MTNIIKNGLLFSLLLTAVPFLKAQNKFTLEDIFLNKKFSPRKLNIFQLIDDNTYLSSVDYNSAKTTIIWENKFSSNSKKKIFDSNILKSKLNIDNAVIDVFNYISDSVFLVGIEKEQIYRHSYQAKYFYVNLKKDIVVKISNGTKIKYPIISPNRNKLAYVRDSNIFIYDFQTKKVKQITKDGCINQIINGGSDWATEEEFFLTSAMWWSPDSKSLAYLKFDESDVKTFSIDYYKKDYPEIFKYKYPRAGEQLSKVSAWVYDGKKKSIQIPLDAAYIPRLVWNDKNSLSLLTFNRLQNVMEVKSFNINTRHLSTWYREEDKRYIDIPQLYRILPDGQLAITSEKSGYNHLYFIGKDQTQYQITEGRFSIEEIYRIDLDDSLIVFSANLPRPENKSVLLWNMKTKEMQYVSDTSGFTTATMLGNGKYLERFSNQSTRSKISLKSLKDKSSLLLLNDCRLEDTVLSKKRFFWMPMKNYVLRAWEILPPDFDSTCIYPVIFYVYGGPGAQTVKNTWHGNIQLWLNYMAQQGFIIYSVDNRGTGGRGADFKKMTYGKLGVLETGDQIEAIKYVNSLPYIDTSRISMFGWSYGGYLTLKTMENSNLLQKGISIAPVTDWQFYDAIYTERYMRTPIGNPEGYKKSSVLNNTNQLSGELLLIHGTADDNVHFQNSLEFVKKLNANGGKYRFMPFPNGRHGIGSSQTLYNMFRQITDFLRDK